MKKNFELIDKLLYSRLFYILSTFVFIAIAVFMFSIHRVRNTSYPIDYNLFGTLGDFVGGILGTIFALISTLLVVHTFRHQQRVTNDNKHQLETQRFNDLFFELIKLYQTEVKELCGEISYKKGKKQINIKYNDKDFFDYEKMKLQDAFNNQKSFHANYSMALNYYMQFYMKNRTKIAAYFRTIYRIYNLIDSSNLYEEDKKNYLKIMRAQLTESELFFIRYNALSYYGYNLIKYINKYNILKHLPALELLEFKDWWGTLGRDERMGLNIVFNNIQKQINYALSNDKKKENENKEIFLHTNKYSINITTKGQYDVCILLTIKTMEKNNRAEFKAFDKMNYKKIQQLLDCIIKEIFIFSNFSKFNNENELTPYSDKINNNNNIVYIKSGIMNNKKNPLHLREEFTN